MDSTRQPRASAATNAHDTERVTPAGMAASTDPVASPLSEQHRQQWSTPTVEKVGSIAEATLQGIT
jgi:hypothetical protein